MHVGLCGQEREGCFGERRFLIWLVCMDTDMNMGYGYGQDGTVSLFARRIRLAGKKSMIMHMRT